MGVSLYWLQLSLLDAKPRTKPGMSSWRQSLVIVVVTKLAQTAVLHNYNKGCAPKDTNLIDIKVSFALHCQLDFVHRFRSNLHLTLQTKSFGSGNRRHIHTCQLHLLIRSGLTNWFLSMLFWIIYTEDKTIKSKIDILLWKKKAQLFSEPSCSADII